LFKKFCINEINSNLAESIRHKTIKKRDMKSVLKLSETEIVTINTIDTNDYLDSLLSLGYDLEKVELIKIY
jgi:hypothetical protein